MVGQRMSNRGWYGGAKKAMKTNKNKIQNSGGNGKQEPEVRGQGSVAEETPEQWWSKLSAVQRMHVQQIGAMMNEVTESKRIEIRKELDRIRARFVHILKQPEKGCLSAIMLPEVSGVSWN